MPVAAKVAVTALPVVVPLVDENVGEAVTPVGSVATDLEGAVTAEPFLNPLAPNQPFYFTDPVNGNGFTIYPFDQTNTIPVPLVDNNELSLIGNGSNPSLHYIAFNYLGQLVSSTLDRDVTGGGADIPIAQGSVAYPLNVPTKNPLVPNTALGASAIVENPVGNSTNITYNVVHIDPLTGRATLVFHQVQ